MRKRKKRLHYKFKLGLKEKVKELKTYVKVDEPNEELQQGYVHIEVEYESESKIEKQESNKKEEKARDSTKI